MNSLMHRPTRRFLRNSASIVVLAAALALAQPGPARAGVVSDALDTLASWVSGIEQAISAWFDETLGQINITDREESAALAVAELASQNPGGLSSIAERAGFRLAEIGFSDRGRRVDTLTFTYERAIDREGRLALWRDVLEVEDTPFRPEMELVRLLLNASDMQENRAPAGLRMTAVTLRLDDESLAASWKFSPAE